MAYIYYTIEDLQKHADYLNKIKMEYFQEYSLDELRAISQIIDQHNSKKEDEQ